MRTASGRTEGGSSYTPVSKGKLRGKVKWFSDAKGFGFITRADGQRDIFVHYSGIKGDTRVRRSLDEGAEVEFEIEQGQKGLQATNVVAL